MNLPVQAALKEMEHPRTSYTTGLQNFWFDLFILLAVVAASSSLSEC